MSLFRYIPAGSIEEIRSIKAYKGAYPANIVAGKIKVRGSKLKSLG